MSPTRRVFVDFLVERYAGKTRIIAELQTLVGDDPASPLQFSEEFIGNAACKAKEGSSNVLRVNGISLHVEDHGSGKPVLLLHGWPDSSYLWRHQIPFLVANGFRAIAPDLRGFGRSDRPEGVAAYSLLNAVADAVGLLDALGIDAADIVAHDWGAGVAWLTAIAYPNRVRRLVVLSVPHPLAPSTLRSGDRDLLFCPDLMRAPRRGPSTAPLTCPGRNSWGRSRKPTTGNRYVGGNPVPALRVSGHALH